jgi:hypothetical protein
VWHVKHHRRFIFTTDQPLSRLAQTPTDGVEGFNDISRPPAAADQTQREPSLLDLLLGLPDTGRWEFDPVPIQIQLGLFDLDPHDAH